MPESTTKLEIELPELPEPDGVIATPSVITQLSAYSYQKVREAQVAAVEADRNKRADRIESLERQLSEAQGKVAQIKRVIADCCDVMKTFRLADGAVYKNAQRLLEHPAADGKPSDCSDNKVAPNKRGVPVVDDIRENYQWLANRVLYCDYGDNEKPEGAIGWGIRHDLRDGKQFMFGTSIDQAIKSARLAEYTRMEREHLGDPDARTGIYANKPKE